jgi:hypothetical protein
VYLFIYIAPIIALYVLPLHWLQRLPRLVGNSLFFFPQISLPFGALVWGRDLDNATFVFGNFTAFGISALYLVLLGLLFSFVTRSIQRFRWVVPLAFCFSILSVILLNLAFELCGITVELDGP